MFGRSQYEIVYPLVAYLARSQDAPCQLARSYTKSPISFGDHLREPTKPHDGAFGTLVQSPSFVNKEVMPQIHAHRKRRADPRSRLTPEIIRGELWRIALTESKLCPEMDRSELTRSLPGDRDSLPELTQAAPTGALRKSVLTLEGISGRGGAPRPQETSSHPRMKKQCPASPRWRWLAAQVLSGSVELYVDETARHTDA